MQTGQKLVSMNMEQVYSTDHPYKVVMDHKLNFKFCTPFTCLHQKIGFNSETRYDHIIAILLFSIGLPVMIVPITRFLDLDFVQVISCPVVFFACIPPCSILFTTPIADEFVASLNKVFQEL